MDLEVFLLDVADLVEVEVCFEIELDVVPFVEDFEVVCVVALLVGDV